MPDPPVSTMRRDVISAYGLTASRILSWIVVSGAVYRVFGADDFAIVALVRATVGLIGYVSLGIGPAIVRLLSIAQSIPNPVVTVRHSELSPPVDKPAVFVSGNAQDESSSERISSIYRTGEAVALLAGAAGLILAALYAPAFRLLHDVPDEKTNYVGALVLAFGVGIVFRVISDAPSALLQVRGKIALDNGFAMGAEICWMGLSVLWISDRDNGPVLIGIAFGISNLILLIVRAIAGRLEVRLLTRRIGRYDRQVRNALLSYGAMVTIAQLADFLYSPVDFILINRLIDPEAVAIYAPAVHIDAGLLVLITGLAAVLLPKSALAHASGDIERVRRYYVLGTLATAAMLFCAAVLVWGLSPWIFRLWLDDAMRPTQVILPLVLVHTVVGGSSAVGRSILIGMGKVKPFTISVLAAGVANVIFSFVFVRFLEFGLCGIVLGTIIVVVARAGIWMPWYVLRSLRHAERGLEIVTIPPQQEIP